MGVSIGSIKPTQVYFFNGSYSGIPITLDSGGTNIKLFATYGELYGESAPFDVNGAGNSAAVSGVVRNGTDNPIVGATVYINNGSGPLNATTDEKGIYRFSNLFPGSYSIYASNNTGGQSRKYTINLAAFPPSTLNLRIGSACNPSGLTPILFVPGIMGSTTGGGIHPDLPKDSPSRTDSRWGLTESESSWGLHDPRSWAGWRNLEKKFKEIDPQYEIDCNLFPVPYDWRMEISSASRKYLKPWIDDAKSKSGMGKVHIIAHSMGGLLARSYIQSKDYNNDIDKFAMVGTPNKGSEVIYYIWEGGDPIAADEAGSLWPNIDEFRTNTAIALFRTMYGKSPRSGRYNPFYRYDMWTLFREHVPSVKQILPTYSFLNPNGELTCETNSWLDDLNSDDDDLRRMGKENSSPEKVKTKIFRGDKKSTVFEIPVGKKDCTRDFFYKDGKPGIIFYKSADIGDGTVKMESAYLGDFVDYSGTKKESHAFLIDKFIPEPDSLVEFITGKKVANPFKINQDSSNSNELVVSFKGRVSPYLVNPQGEKAGINPNSNLYESEVSGTTINLKLDGGYIKIEQPIDGSYNLFFKNNHNEDFEFSIDHLNDNGAKSQTYSIFNHANVISISLLLESNSSPKFIINHAPLRPEGLQPQFIESGDSKTRLTWNANTDAGVTGYNIYSKYVDEPYLSQIATTLGTSFDTGHDWAANNLVKSRIYAVAAVKADGAESFLSDPVENNDRDHDGLTDAEETALGTNVSNPDTDRDGLLDGEEYYLGTNPKLRDTDGDGYSDRVEVLAGSDPLDPNSTPRYFIFLPLLLK